MSEPKRNGADRSMLNALLVIEVAQKRGRRGGLRSEGTARRLMVWHLLPSYPGCSVPLLVPFPDAWD